MVAGGLGLGCHIVYPSVHPSSQPSCPAASACTPAWGFSEGPLLFLPPTAVGTLTLGLWGLHPPVGFSLGLECTQLRADCAARSGLAFDLLM